MTSPMTMRYCPPPARVSDRISSLYELCQDSAHFEEVERADRPQFRVLLAGSGEYHFANGAVDPAYPIMIVGPTSGPIRTIGRGPVHAVGAGLLPMAWATLMGAESEKWTDRAIDASLIFGDSVDVLRDAMLGCACPDGRFALVSDFIAAAITTDAGAPFWFTRIVDAWLSDNPDPQIDTLVAQTGLGMRQIERLAKRYYGLPPKTLARKYRALRAAAALARGEDIGNSDLGDCFYDQSHLIREVKRFAGFTPQQIRSQHSLLQVEVSQGRKSLEGKVSPLVSDA